MHEGECAPFYALDGPTANLARKEAEEKMKKLILTIAIAMITAFAIGSSLTDGLVGYWPFNGNANDMSGNGNNGVVHGAEPTSDRNGTANHAFYFGGYYSGGFKDVAYIEVPNSQSLYSISSSFTLMAWIRIDKWCHDGGTGIENWASIICKGYNTLQYSLQIEGNDHKYWYGVTASPITVSAIPSLHVWRHVALTKNGNRLSAYINGNKVASGDIRGAVIQTTESLYFGMDNPGRLEYFNGAMDEVYIYNRALSATEIRAIQHNKLNDEEFYVVSFHPNANDVVGDMLDQSFDVDKEQKLSKNTYRKDGYVFQGWAVAADGEVVYKDEEVITVDSDMPLYAVWAKRDCIIHFNANGGVFKDKDGNAVTQFDQHFTCGEKQRLFTDDLTPMRMDGSGNRFLGWTTNINISSSAQLIDSGKEWPWDDDETEVTFYAVWTTTVTVWFYNEKTTAGNKSLSPSSLAEHLRWSVDDGSTEGRKTVRCGESIEVCPGQRTVKLHCDDNYHWIAGQFGFDGNEPLLNMVSETFELEISNDCTDWPVPRPAGRDIYVKVEPQLGENKGDFVEFLCSSEIRESLRDRIKPEDVPFDSSKVRITIGCAAYNEWGCMVPLENCSLSGLEAYELYYLPKGMYYIKTVSYDVDTNDGVPFWGAVIDSSFEGKLFEVGDGEIKKVTIRFDMFGGLSAVRVEFNPQEGRCDKSEMWFEYPGGAYQPVARIIYKLPTPKKEGFEFAGWFTSESGGQWKKEGSDITDCTLFAHWTEMTREWLEENTGALFPELANLDIATIANTTAANGCRTVGECYALGIDPEDPDDDLKITDFEMKDGKPVITLNHTKDGSGNSFMPRVKTLGAKSLGASAQGTRALGDAAQWDDMADVADPEASDYRFFKVYVEVP